MTLLTRASVACVALLLSCAVPCRVQAQSASPSRVQLTFDASEAEQVLAILSARAEGRAVDEAQWQKLFATEPYQLLKTREAEIGKQFNAPDLAFTDDDFRKFVLGPELLARREALLRALDEWKRADLPAAATRILTYLPDQAIIKAKVFPMIKPRRNSFVFKSEAGRAVFLYLDPALSPAVLENTVAHEMHHIGLSSLGPAYERRIADLPDNARAAAEWMGAFGEGTAMLAAAGGPDVHPHAASPASDRARWEKDLSNSASDLATVNAFFEDVLDGKLATSAAIDEKGSAFFGETQGPWYTVGYRMAVLVERRFGRAALIETMTDPRRLLALYNQAAREQNAAAKEKLPLWSQTILDRVHAKP